MRKMRIFPAFLTVSFLFASSILQSAPSPDKETTKSEAVVIDVSGSLHDLPLGTTEEKVIAKLGQPSGSIRFDEKRTALIYGKNFLLLFYEGIFDGVRISSSSTVDWKISLWQQDHPLFPGDKWRISNGLHKEMALDDAIKILGVSPIGNDNHKIHWSTEKCDWNFDISRIVYRPKNTGSEKNAPNFGKTTLHLGGLLLTRRHEGKDYWPDRNVSFSQSPNGKKKLGFQVRSTENGMRTLFVYKDSPADKAGIQSGDLIERINDTPTKGMTMTELNVLIEKADSHLLHIIPRSPGKQPYTVTLTKADSSTFTQGVISGSRLDFMEVGPGQIAPDFSATTPDGKIITLAEMKGQPVLIHFAATGKTMEREQLPPLDKIYEKFSKRGMEVISVFLDETSNDFVTSKQNLKINWPVRIDGKFLEGEVARAYGPIGLPCYVLVGSDGTILKTGLHHSNLEEKLSELLGP
jgi:peroxiredoxin